MYGFSTVSNALVYACGGGKSGRHDKIHTAALIDLLRVPPPDWLAYEEKYPYHTRCRGGGRRIDHHRVQIRQRRAALFAAGGGDRQGRDRGAGIPLQSVGAIDDHRV